VLLWVGWGIAASFRVLACRWFAGWRRSLLIVEPVTVLRRPGLAGLLAMALKTEKQGGWPSNNTRVTRSYSTHGDRDIWPALLQVLLATGRNWSV
jgi:hypothetical protein